MASTTYHERRSSATISGRRTWTPAQFVAGAIGLFLLVMGGVAIARAGFDGGLTAETVSVFGFGHTALLGIIEATFGFIMLLAAASPYGSRAWLGAMGVIALAFGLIVTFEADALAPSLGTEQANGVLYTILGVASVVAAWLSPMFTTGRTEVIHHDDKDLVAERDRVVVAEGTTPAVVVNGNGTPVATTTPVATQVATAPVVAQEHVVVVDK